MKGPRNNFHTSECAPHLLPGPMEANAVSPIDRVRFCFMVTKAP